jgi:5-methyltetrahydropteroyltriglutamate--homocysteine methyltransferase
VISVDRLKRITCPTLCTEHRISHGFGAGESRAREISDFEMTFFVARQSMLFTEPQPFLFRHLFMTTPAFASPPFRADHVGSLLRPSALRDARIAFKAGRLDASALKIAEDEHIAKAITRQTSIGLKSITDGEMRRDWWHLDFLAGFEGIDLRESQAMNFKAEDEIPPTAYVSGKIRLSRPNMVDHFSFLQSQVNPAAGQVAKFTIPSPAMAHLRSGSKDIPISIYPDRAQYWEDLGTAYRQAIAALYQAGCRYLQMDDITFSYLADEKVQAMVTANGDDAVSLHKTYAHAVNLALRDRPADMAVTMHTCRGNFKSTWVSETPYAADIMQSMFSTDVDAYFMEFDSERAGSFDVLKLLPPKKQVVLGLVTTKFGELESKDTIKRRIDLASKVVPLERLALSPQCGFSSTHHGNNLSEDDQWRKLEFIVKVAEEVWG